MNLLTERLPETVCIDGKAYGIHSDFRTWIRIDLILFESELGEEQRILEVLRLCYRELPPKLTAAVQGILEFYCCGKAGIKKKKNGESKKRVYSFSVDGNYIYAAFLSQYGIDLTSAQLHWWEFCSLFEGLEEENKICKIMGWRAMDLSKVKDKRQKEFYRRMKALYPLRDCRSDKQKETDMVHLLEQMI